MKDRATSNERTETRKRQLRQRYLRHRGGQTDMQVFSRQICNRLTALPEYRSANTLSTYVSMPTEVQTLELITEAWNDGKKVTVPCCIENQLRMFHLESMEDLAPRTLGILEPRDELRRREERWLDVSRIDLFVVPGIAFDRSGGRLGYGKGYYDRLLADAQPSVPKIALALECQIIDRVPMTARDIFMDYVITEKTVYRCSRE